MSAADQNADPRPIRRIDFVDRPPDGDTVLLTFRDPALRYAVMPVAASSQTTVPASAPHSDSLEVILLQGTPADWPQITTPAEGPPPVFLKYRGVELLWRPTRVMLQCDPEQTDSLLAAIAEFTHYERELRQIESEIAEAWPELEQDRSLAFEVAAADLKRSAAVGERMGRTFERRIRLARIEPHLYHPDAKLAAAAQKLGEELRERARIESRLEIVDSQQEVFEHIYEMTSQRMGEYRAAREEHTLEWIIIVLLAAEAALMLAQVSMRHWL